MNAAGSMAYRSYVKHFIYIETVSVVINSPQIPSAVNSTQHVKNIMVCFKQNVFQNSRNKTREDQNVNRIKTYVQNNSI